MKPAALLSKIIRIAIALWIAVFFVDTFILEGSLNEILAIVFLSVILPPLAIQGLRGKFRPGGDAG